jgi:Mrp family chromosome partitioning ATPase
LVSVAADDAGAFSLSVLAAKLSSEGSYVTLVDMADGRPLSKLFKVASGGQPQVVRVDNWAVTVVIAPADPGEVGPPQPTSDADVVLVLTTLDPALGADHLVGWAGSAVVMLTVGKATETTVQSTGQMLRQVGLPPVSVILLGAGREDESVGALDPGQPLGPRPGTVDGVGPDGTVTWPGVRVPPGTGHFARQP